MVKRRSMVIGLGALASGSGAVFSSATFQNSAESDADFRIVSQPGLTLRRGDAFSSGYSWAYGPGVKTASFINPVSAENPGIDFSDLKPSDLPVAWANEQEDGSLVVQLARQNNSSDVDFNQLIEVENTGQTDENVGISYAGGYAPVNDGSTPNWFVDGYATNNPTDEITKADVQQIFTFQTNSDDTQISPDSGTNSDEPNTHYTLGSGNTVQVDLKTTLNGDQTSVFAKNSGGGDPFVDSPATGSLQLLDRITVGTDFTTE
ncbi:hypothetical protein GJ633_05925 [Halorubrum sp. CBA1125]|uniref:hypothetical protein n=1 Tax=Halorubrum sp. CBA1125 TaxID=2668072 RepID=UPI0012E8DB3C|nr:hypothetical protein [Halorubrum sp. CBA1125]MUW14246.1 hypothetical protein [Halorubrum sp. CBA1125]